MEKRIENAIKKALAERGWLVFKVHGNAFQESGFPDLLCWKTGIPAAIEVKQPGKEPTKLQLHQLERLKNHGVIAGWATSVEEALELLGEN